MVKPNFKLFIFNKELQRLMKQLMMITVFILYWFDYVENKSVNIQSEDPTSINDHQNYFYDWSHKNEDSYFKKDRQEEDASVDKSKLEKLLKYYYIKRQPALSLETRSKCDTMSICTGSCFLPSRESCNVYKPSFQICKKKCQNEQRELRVNTDYINRPAAFQKNATPTLLQKLS